jgi:hypothetical protein
MTAPRLPCVCGCPQGRHLMGRRDCRSCQTCSEYEPADVQPEASPEPVVLDVTALLGEVQADADREAELTVEVERLRREIRDLSEHIPCGWCDGLGVAPGERFGRDADGAPNVDEDRPCPEGCKVPAWLQAERNDAADNERELADAKRQISDLYKNEEIRARLLRERSAEIKSLRVQLEHAEQYARDLQDDGVVPAGTVVVLFAYDAWQCLGGSVNCSRRYFADDPDHGCGPLTPVTVTVSRRPA